MGRRSWSDRRWKLWCPSRSETFIVMHRSEYTRNPAARPMGAGLPLHGRRRDGTVFPIDVSLSPLVFDQRPRTVAFVRDATDRRRSDRLMEYVNEVTRSVS